MHYESLQIIRAFAAILVVFYHLVPSLSVGAFGVDIFFVLSGAVMAMISEKEPLPVDFWLRRVARIWPLYFICTSAFLFVLLCARKDFGINSLGTMYAKSIFFLPSLDPRAPLLRPGWTLNYEIFFYAVISASIFVFSRRAVHAALFFLSSLALMGSLLCISVERQICFSPLLTEFALGIAAWTFRPKSSRFKPPQFWLVLGICLGLMSAIQYYIEPGLLAWFADKRWARVALYGPIGLVLIWSALGTAIARGDCRLVDKFIQIGDASYALYLTHIFVLYGLVHFSPETGRPIYSQIISTAICLPLALGLGLAVHRWVDSPIQRALRKLLIKAEKRSP